MKTLFAFVLLGMLSTSVFADVTPEQARADIKSLIKQAVIKGEVIDGPTHRYNVTMVMTERDAGRIMEITLGSPIYMVRHGIITEQGNDYTKNILINNSTYMIKKTEGTEGPLTVVTYSLRNKERNPDAPSRERVSRQEIKIFTRANGALVRVILTPNGPDGIGPRLFVPKQWEHPRRL